MKKITLLTLMLLSSLLFFNSCGEDETMIVEPTPPTNQGVLGCTEANACNYEPNATENNGSCYTCSDCSGATLESSSIRQSIDINVFDLNPSSPYYNQVFSTLNITWHEEKYCRSAVDNFIITFRNVTSNTITFDYYIESNGNGTIRSKQGFVQSLTAGNSFVKEEGDNAFWNLVAVPITVRVNSIQYQ